METVQRVETLTPRQRCSFLKQAPTWATSQQEAQQRRNASLDNGFGRRPPQAAWWWPMCPAVWYGHKRSSPTTW